jgi:hypothetical protein
MVGGSKMWESAEIMRYAAMTHPPLVRVSQGMQ